MRTLLLTGLACLLFVPLGMGQVYNDDGDPVSAGVISPDLVNNGNTGSRGPGDILNTITGPYSSPKGMGHDGTNLLLIYLTTEITIVDESTGNYVGSIPIAGTSDFGLAYDNVRGVYVTTNASSDTVKVFDGVSSQPIKVWASPGPGPVGTAHDIRRDVYWICDWQNDNVTSVDPETGTPLTTYDTSAYNCTRNVGVEYDWINDEIIIGGRDQVVIIVMDAATGALLPLNWDFFTDITIALANSPILVNTLGTLLPDGTESAKLVVPGALPPAAVGLRFFFAYPAVAGPPWFASTPEIIVVIL